MAWPKKAHILVAIAALSLAPLPAFGVPVYGTLVGSTNLTGSRTSLAGQIGNAGAGNTTLSWNITDNRNGTMHYAYTLTTTAKNTISHFILDLSDNCTTVGSCFNSLSVVAPDTFGGTAFGSFSSSIGNSNPSMPGTIAGVKVDSTQSADGIFSFGFTSDRVAVWGDFYSKGGNVVTQPSKAFAVWNMGLAAHSSMNIMDFIAVPDTFTVCNPNVEHCGAPGMPSGSGTPIPEPSSLPLLGAGILGLYVARRRRIAN